MTLLRMGLVGAASLAVSMAATPAAADYDWTDVESALATAPFLRGALVIMHKGEVRYARGFGTWLNYDEEAVLGDDPPGQSPAIPVDNPVNVASLSKSFAAIAAIAAIEDPVVADFDYETPLSRWVSGVDSNMKIKHLLAMTNGQNSTLPFPVNPLTCVNNPLFNFATCGQNMATRPQAKKYPLNLLNSERWAPGEAFSYGSVPWQALGLAMQRAVNEGYGLSMTYTQIVAKYLTGANACNLSNTSIDLPHNEWPAGGFITNPKDGIALAELMRTGACGGHSVLSATGLSKMRTNIRPDATQSNPAKKLNLGYGMGVWTDPETAANAECEVCFGVGAWGAVAFFSTSTGWSAYLHLNDHLPIGESEGIIPLIEAAYEDATELALELAPLINAQADANP